MNDSKHQNDTKPNLKTVSALNVDVGMVTHIGNVRKLNEDTITANVYGSLWVVADGMGGHKAGDKASQAVCSRLQNLTLAGNAFDRILTIENALKDVNQTLLAERPKDICGTTVALVHAFDGLVLAGWVGDSRIYRYRTTLEQISVDHSHVQNLVEAGTLTQEDAEAHPMANVITRAVGAEDELLMDVRIENRQKGDRYLICSDGLTKDLSHSELEMHLSQGTPEQVCQRLLDAALASGGGDNISIIVLAFEDVSEKYKTEKTNVEYINQSFSQLEKQLRIGALTKSHFGILRENLIAKVSAPGFDALAATTPISESSPLHDGNRSTFPRKTVFLVVVLLLTLALGGIYVFR